MIYKENNPKQGNGNGDRFFNKAQANLSAAKFLFDGEFFDSSVNRAYYAAFQAAAASLAHRGIKKDRIDHDWVQAQFNGNLIGRTKVYPAKIRPYLADMQTIRSQADYKSNPVGKKNASRQIAKAEEMLQLIGKELGK